jgi:hypothetical protein
MPVEVYMLYKFVSDLSVVFTRYSDFLHQTGFSEKTRNIVENGDKSNQKQTKVVPNVRLCDGSDIQQFVQ